MLDQESINPPPPDGGERGGNGAEGPTTAAPSARPGDDPADPSFQAFTQHVAGAVTDSTGEVLHRFARELREVLTSIRSRLDDASARLASELEAYRDAPAQIAEALATLGEALGEIAGAHAAVDERLEALSREAAELRSAVDGKLAALGTAAAERHERLSSSVDALAVPLAALREEVAGLRARLETRGRSRAAARLAADLSAVEARLDHVEATVAGDLVDAVFERMEQAFDRRFDALVQIVDARLRDVPVAIPTEPGRRGILRRA